MTTDTTDSRAAFRPRAVWIDRLLAGHILLVILYHAAITYGARGRWFLKATEATNIPLDLLAAVNQAFFMGLFFLISSALAPSSLDRKRAMVFLTDRVLRLGMPVLVFGVVLGPLTVALASAPVGDILGDAGQRILRGRFILGPLWFPAALLIFPIVLAVWPGRCGAARPVPPVAHWLALALATGLAALLIWQIVPVGATVALILWSQRRGDRAAAFWSRAAANSYGAFILHAPILLASSRALDGMGAPHGVALPVSVVATALAAFGLTALLRRSALVRRAV